MTFTSLELHPLVLKAIEKTGYTTPTPIQEKAIPCVLKGDDLLASAQTGTGKTAAFVLPILHKLATAASTKKGNGPRALILTPTRELAQQISEAARKYALFIEKAAIVSIVGGVPYDKQRQKLRKPIDIMVATPGRLIDYLDQKAIDFSRVETLVLDEADRMLDMGFVDAVREISAVLPKERQTLLFSATLDKSVIQLAGSILRNPISVSVTPERTRHELIEQSVQFVATQHEKTATLATLLKTETFAKAIVFVATKRSADDISKRLNRDGLYTAALHGDMRQGARNRTVRELTSNEINIVVATDVAARGLDVKNVDLIINYDLPRQSEDYVHRIGRTGRAGAKGKAISLAYNKEKRNVNALEKYLGHTLLKTFSEASKTEEAEFASKGPRERSEGRGGFSRGGGRGGRFGGGARDGGRGERRSSGGGFGRKFERPFTPRDDAPRSSDDGAGSDTTKPPFERRSSTGGGRGGFKPRFPRRDRPQGDGPRTEGYRPKFGGFKKKFGSKFNDGAPRKSFGPRSEDSTFVPRDRDAGTSPRGAGGEHPQRSGGGFKKKFGGFKGRPKFGGGDRKPFGKFRRGSGNSGPKSAE
jgi:superfamily II DNA/RNA helicase